MTSRIVVALTLALLPTVLVAQDAELPQDIRARAIEVKLQSEIAVLRKQLAEAQYAAMQCQIANAAKSVEGAAREALKAPADAVFDWDGLTGFAKKAPSDK